MRDKKNPIQTWLALIPLPLAGCPRRFRGYMARDFNIRRKLRGRYTGRSRRAAELSAKLILIPYQASVAVASCQEIRTPISV